MKKFVTLMFVALFALVLVGCGDTGSALKSIKVSGKSTVTVGKSETYTANFIKILGYINTTPIIKAFLGTEEITTI